MAGSQMDDELLAAHLKTEEFWLFNSDITPPAQAWLPT
jgi:hypothetical protein